MATAKKTTTANFKLLDQQTMTARFNCLVKKLYKVHTTGQKLKLKYELRNGNFAVDAYLFSGEKWEQIASRTDIGIFNLGDHPVSYVSNEKYQIADAELQLAKLLKYVGFLFS